MWFNTNTEGSFRFALIQVSKLRVEDCRIGWIGFICFYLDSILEWELQSSVLKRRFIGFNYTNFALAKH